MLQVGSHIQICNNCSSSQDLLGRTHEGRSVAGRKSRLSALPHPADVCLPLWLPFRPPTNCGAPFPTLPESLTSLTIHLRAHQCSPACPPLPWEQKDFNGNSMGTQRISMGTRWKQEEFHGNFLGIWWEQKDIDGNLMGTKGIWWELFVNWWK